MIGSGLADVDEDVWLIHLGDRVACFLCFCFFPFDDEEDDILCMLFLFHSGVHTTLLVSGVFLGLDGVLGVLVLGGVLCGDDAGLP